jgi:hypothetical protein
MPSWLGTVCILAAFVFFVVEVMPASDRLAKFIARAATVKAQQALGQGAIVLSPAQQLAAFYSSFPQGAAIPDVLAGIYQIATEQQLSLEIGEYAMFREQGARLDQFRITLPVKGSYLQVRKFIGEVLHAQPALSLENFAVRREKLAQDAVDGHIVFLLFLEHAP